MSISERDRRTQSDWCNEPQPCNWRNACMRPPGHDGDHAVRKAYRSGECFAWPGPNGSVRSTYASSFLDLWDLPADRLYEHDR